MSWIIRHTKEAVTAFETCADGVEANEGGNVVCIYHSDDKFLERMSKIASANRLSGITYVSVRDETDRIELFREFDYHDSVDLGTDEDFVSKMKLERLPYFGQVSGETF